ncbi:MAG: hypothetical protein DBY06_01475 [Clostridiales bacterium]|nr:MAG: hypothetical protein DBY06_01475 [Clostridiales bacterium]
MRREEDASVGKGTVRLLTGKDIWLLLGALALAGIAALVFHGGAGGDRLRIYVGESLYREVSLAEDQEIQIQQADGSWNLLVIQQGQAYMKAASCPNQDCVHQSPLIPGETQLRPLGRWIVCLPNQVSVELVEEGE